jgi:anti-sigma regulatory factor (Ser/Thr protein kinase)
MAVELEDITVGAGDHVVQFYEHDAQLASTVGRYLSAALDDGGVAIVIATAAHRRALEAELEAAGVNAAACCADGALVYLDAAATMAGFIHEGQVDHENFRRIVGSVVRQAAETGRPVHAYGEMVALLWEAGEVLGTIELERAWNDLGRELPFALVCGYRGESVQGDEHAEALQQICQLHSSVLQTSPTDDQHTRSSRGRISAHFEVEPTAPRHARHFVAQSLTRWGYGDALLEDAQLVVTELATNAIVHARTPFSVHLQPHGHQVRLAVADGSPVRPTLRDAAPLATCGRGLRLVDAVAATWGVELGSDGKTVWAEL